MVKGATKRLVLGFDAGCSTCAEMAHKVKEKVGEKLEVVNLRDPQVVEWRKEALGEDAPWAPTLFEVNGGVVRAWTGKRMGLKLGSVLGPVATWRVVQVLGEVGVTPEVAEASPMARVGASMSRGQFLKGIGGAAVAMGVLSATGNLASAAPGSTVPKEITGERAVKIARRVARSRDVVNVAGEEFREQIQRGGVIRQCQNGECLTIINGGNCRVRQSNGGLSLSDDCIVIRVGRRKLEAGNSQLVVTYGYADRAVVYYEYDEPVDGVESEATLLRADGENAILDNRSQNGELDLPLSEPASGFRALSSDPCGGCNGAPGARYLGESCETTSVVACVFAVGGCATCAVSCGASGGGGVVATGACIGCLTFSCGSIFLSCCNKKAQGCRYCGCSTC